MWNSEIEDNSIYTTAEWCSRENEQDITGKIKEYAQWCRFREKIWAEAVMTACYLINRSPSSALGDKTPHEVWCGKKPSLRHLRVFGCEAYVHVPKEKRTKLDYKAHKCIFIGYGDGIKGCKC